MLKYLSFFSRIMLPWILSRRQREMPKRGISLVMITCWSRPRIQNIVANDTRRPAKPSQSVSKKHIVVFNHEYYNVGAIRPYHMEVDSLHIIDAFSPFTEKQDIVLFPCSLVGALSPVNHEGLHQGWTQTSFYLQVIHFTSLYTTSNVWIFFLLKPIYIPRAYNTGTCNQQGDLVYFAGLHRSQY